ncbi:sigma-70 family RNA polymerase sigma factor [Fusibacter bizertensis]|uniref:RNA polymerase sigma factor SigI n=1 Tax=Fusibacter bizertensis TaxID=1488331 RepID=A0ABT6NBZ9_9FIRM|nr:sigma-70 family RNA polymerase sigma factor [Fusibacter bizertensis]MDH8677937.1 sigma-70 family RNA polymerase sigma factor [Fusibacter bizertensis]
MQDTTIIEAKTITEKREQFIAEHIPFVVYTTSKILGRYLSVENDEEYSVALEAFNSAIDTYEAGQSKFETYATTVIRNKLIDYHRSQKKHYGQEALNEDLIARPSSDEELRMEIEDLSLKLKPFGMTFDDLVEASPTHKDSRRKAIDIGVKASTITSVITLLYTTLKLPVQEILKFIKTTRRFLYLHRHFILVIIVIFKEDLVSLKEWILETKRPQK